jgi:hypothetical protein
MRKRKLTEPGLFLMLPVFRRFEQNIFTALSATKLLLQRQRPIPNQTIREATTRTREVIFLY